jgi:hypothetical protein
MTIGELKEILSTYEDGQLVLVEGQVGDFEEPNIYVTSVRAKRGNEFPAPSGPGFAAVIVGTTRMLVYPVLS